MTTLEPVFTGFITAIVLIVAIGAQNAFVLRHGLMRAHVGYLCLFAAASDAILITAGIAGLGYMVELYPLLPFIMLIGGSIFLMAYGAMRFMAAYRGDYAVHLAGQAAPLGRTLLAFAAITWLNPHVYLDTMVLIGAVSLQYTEMPLKFLYGIGAVGASFSFFFAFGYAAHLLAPYVRSKRSWQIMDVLIGLVMWGLAVKLIAEISW